MIDNADAELDTITNIEIDEELFMRRLRGEDKVSVTIDLETIEKIREALQSVGDLKDFNEYFQAFKDIAPTKDILESFAKIASIEEMREQVLKIDTSQLSDAIKSIQTFIDTSANVNISDALKPVQAQSIENLRSLINTLNISAISDLQETFRMINPLTTKPLAAQNTEGKDNPPSEPEKSEDEQDDDEMPLAND